MPVEEAPLRNPIRSTLPAESATLPHSPPVLGKLAVIVLVLWILFDLAGRLGNPAWLGIDPWLVMSQRPPRFAPFKPDQKFYMQTYIGGNARQANLPPTETAGPITFSTDHLGFRLNPFLHLGERPETLFFKGDSFTYGVGLSDDQTIASILTSRFGIPSYNGGRFHDDPEGLPELDWLLTHLPGRPSTLIYTYLEHQPLVAPAEMHGIDGAIMRRNPRLEGDLRYAKLLNTFFWELSPTRVITTRWFKKLTNDVIFPNEGNKTVQMMTLPDGQRMLFRDYEFLLADQDRGPAFLAQTTRGFKWLAAECRKRNLRLIVLLMPNRYTLYKPALDHRDEEWTHYLDKLKAQLDGCGIESVNGLEVYRSGIDKEIATGQLSFYREDAHWNTRGVAKIAQALAMTLNNKFARNTDGSHVIQ